MKLSPSLVELAVGEAFPEADASSIVALLNTYGTESHERERERVQLAIVKLCDGDAGKVQSYIDVAKTDYRDVLHWASRPAPTAQEAAKDLHAVREVLTLWGKK